MANYLSRLREGLSNSIRTKLNGLSSSAYVRATDLAFSATKFARHPLGRLSIFAVAAIGVASLAEAQGYFESMYGDVDPTGFSNNFAGDLITDPPLSIDLSEGDELGAFMNGELAGFSILDSMHAQNDIYGPLTVFGDDFYQEGIPVEFRFFNFESGLEHTTEQFGTDAPATFTGDGTNFTDLNLNVTPEPSTIAPLGTALGYLGLRRKRKTSS